MVHRAVIETMIHSVTHGLSDWPGGDQPLAEPLDSEEWEALKNRYYELCGWNVDNGRPARTKLDELGMKGIADTLQSASKLG